MRDNNVTSNKQVDDISFHRTYGGIKSVERALDIVQVLAETRSSLTATELARRLRLHRAIVFRLLSSLMTAGFVSSHTPGPHYRLTFKLIALANSYIDSLEFADLFQPILRRLSNETGELIQLALVDGDHVVRVAKAEGRERLRVVDPIGSRVHLHASATGKAWLSTLSEECALALVCQQGLFAATPNTITSLDELRQDLALARAQGFATCFEEDVLGVHSISAPIVPKQRDLPSVAVGAVTLVAPTVRVSRERLQELGSLVVDAAVEIAQGWPPS